MRPSNALMNPSSVCLAGSAFTSTKPAERLGNRLTALRPLRTTTQDAYFASRSSGRYTITVSYTFDSAGRNFGLSFRSNATPLALILDFANRLNTADVSNNGFRSSWSTDNRYMDTGREWDSVLAQYHFRARIYDANFGRFCSRDPFGFEDRVNTYEYSRSAPHTFVDPSGMICQLTCCCCAESISLIGQRQVHWF